MLRPLSSKRPPGRRIVSVTPLPVALDSRTFKQASSFARAGYDSIVVQGTAGDAPAAAPLFTLLTVPAAPVPPQVEDPADEPADEDDRTLHVVSVADAVEASGELGHHDEYDHVQAVHIPTRDTFLGRMAIRAQFMPTVIRAPLGKFAEWLWMLPTRVLNIAIRLSFRVVLVPAGIKAYVDSSRRAYRVIPPADLYYLHSYVQFPAVFARCLRHRARFVYDAHDFYSILNRDGRPRPLGDRLMWKFYAGVEHICARAAANCLTVSDGVALLQRERFGRDFAVVRNAHDRRLDENGLPSMRENLELGNAFLLVVVGNAKPGGMAIESAIRALQMLPDDVHLLFLGGEYEEHEKTASRLGLESRVHAPGRVAPVHIASAIRDADLAPILYWDATPNLRHCLPNGLFHAIAAGLPILYPDLPEIRAVVEPAGSGLLTDTRDPVALAEAIGRFRAEQDLAGRLQAAARVASTEILWEREELQLLDVVRPLLGPVR